MYINGSWEEALSGETFEVTNPATGEVIGHMPAGGAADAEAAIGAAHEAFTTWSTTTSGPTRHWSASSPGSSLRQASLPRASSR